MRRGRVNALMLTPTFSNPLGYALDHDARRTLAEAADRYGVAIVENDPYRDLFFGDSVPPSIKHFDEAGWVLHCGSFSNNLAPGYNVGWLAAGRFASRVRALRFFSNMTAGLLPQRTIASYLGTGVSRGAYARHLLSLRTKLRERMALGLELLGNVLPAQARFTRPAGGFMVWVTLPKGMDALELNRRAQSRDISIAPGPLYCLSGRHRNAFALNFGWKWDSRRTAALEQIGSLIASDRRH